ncbi:uncharacterized protein DSM5745_03618 [Aspergillus mulundensis]|uniref:DNA2/NAM7 helicase-like C-terminal domain-containing protein n=1 Tax=Aspergillus mulundensis TaxID=1810919 RepID=A0A3D8SL21_9EURO|nr:hypothetical protein DSM5745_03618 [Aspergillus mulundensis]RDW86976.1 hypothetical protein DSM5745_03618 [Aspergillus mulundensis]
MLEVSGIIERPWSQIERFKGFRDYFNDYQDQEERGNRIKKNALKRNDDDDELREFHDSTRRLRDAVLSRTNVLVCTPFAAGTPAVRENVHPDVVAVDEAARLAEPELWPVLAYHDPRVLLLVGDHRQLKPLIFSKPPEAPFSLPLELSLFSRLVFNGHKTVVFLEQHRMSSEICELLSVIFYDGKLRTAAILDAVVGEMNARVVTHNGCNTTFRKESPLIFVNVLGSKEEKEAGSRSLFNHPNCATVYALVRSLMEHQVAAKHITIITPYRAQTYQYSNLFQDFPDPSEVRVHTIDSYQGCESGVVIFDTTVATSTRLGFLADANRLCVALRRPRSGMFLVGDWHKIQGPPHWEDFRNDGLVYSWRASSAQGHRLEYLRHCWKWVPEATGGLGALVEEGSSGPNGHL